MKMTRNIAQLLSVVMAFIMVFSLAAPASAEGDAVSVEVVLAAEDMELSGKITVSPELVMSVGAKLLLNGQSVADLTGFVSTQAAAVESAFLDRAYGVTLANLAENLKGSIFAPDSGTKFAMSEDDFNSLQELLNGGLEAQLPELPGETDSDALIAAFSALGEAFSQAVNDVSDKLAMESAPATVSVNGKDVSTTQVKVTVGTEAMIGICDSLLTSLENSSELQSAVAVIVDAYSGFAFSEDDESISGEEAVQAILENSDDFRQSMTDAVNESAPSVTVTVCTVGEAQIPVKVAMDITADGETVHAALTMSEELDFFRLETVDADNSAEALELVFTENSDTALSFHFGSYEGETETFGVIFDLDKVAQTFETTTSSTSTDPETNEPVTYTNAVSGYYAVTDTLFALTFDKVDGQEMGATVTLNIRTDETVTMPDFSEITKLSETEFASVLEALNNGFETLSQIFGSAVSAPVA